ncbi:MAG: protein kinase [Ktedonobacteraceae bacterium]|nr:protein kinase [Ktedonobacteraceae bacterium]
MQIEVLGERYQLQEPIGRGGMAVIYRGVDTHTNRTVAVKVLREIYSTDPKFVTRFQREAKAASSLKHPHIVQVYDYGQSEGNYYIVMELVEGKDLRRYLRSYGVLTPQRAMMIAHDVALGLGAAHRREIVHRDVKPQNILVGDDGSIKLTDFGIASVYKDLDAERLTTTGMTLGTVQYYAPEQAQGEIVSSAADVYALGIVMYEMLTGHTPFDGDTPVAVAMQHIQDPPLPPSQYNPNITPALEEIILRCLEKVPEMRYRDGSALARALDLLAEQEMGNDLPTKFVGGTPPRTPNTTSSPSQPSNGARATDRGTRGHATSSSSNVLPPSSSTSTIQENGMRDGLGIDQLAPLEKQKPVALSASAQNQQLYSPQLTQSGSDTTRPFRRGMLLGGVEPDQRESRFASIVTVLILLAALLLLGFSIFLAAELGFISIPGLNPRVTATPAVASQLVIVPDLRHETFQQALASARKSGFRVRLSSDSPTTGVVINQIPSPGYRADPKTSVIEVMLAPATPTPATVVMPDVVNLTLVQAEKILNDKHIQYTLVQDSFGSPNVVTSTDPTAGSTITPGTSVKLYVNQYAPTPTPMPSPSPTPTPMPTPTPSPSPSPTPTPTPTTSPSTTPTTQ